MTAARRIPASQMGSFIFTQAHIFVGYYWHAKNQPAVRA